MKVKKPQSGWIRLWGWR